MVTTFREGKFLIQLFSNSNSSIDSTLAVEGPLLKKHVEGCLFESRTEGGRNGISEGDLLKENNICVRGQGTCMQETPSSFSTLGITAKHMKFLRARTGVTGFTKPNTTKTSMSPFGLSNLRNP